MMRYRLQYEAIDQQALVSLKQSRQRRVLADLQNQLIYKLWDADWEFARTTAQGYESGYYDDRLVPNMLGLVEDASGLPRGYAMQLVPAFRHLSSTQTSVLSRPMLRYLAKGHVSSWYEIAMTKTELSTSMLLVFLDTICSRANPTGYVFGEFSLNNLWLDQNGYHVFDLDSLRACAWLFNTDPRDPEASRKRKNLECWQRDLKTLVELHGLVCPQIPSSEHTLAAFVGAIREVNKLPQGVALYSS